MNWDVRNLANIGRLAIKLIRSGRSAKAFPFKLSFSSSRRKLQFSRQSIVTEQLGSRNGFLGDVSFLKKHGSC